MLKRNGWDVLEAANGNQALEVLGQSEAPSLIITDVVMPVMNGVELAQRVAAEQPGQRILFMSGYSDEPLVQDLANLQGSSLFLQKPFTSAALICKVREVLGRPWLGLSQTIRES